MSEAPSDVVVVALAFALGLLIVGWGLARTLRKLRRRFRHLLRHLRHPSAVPYQEFYRLVEEARVLERRDRTAGTRAEEYMRVAKLVRAGEWTTYGDISKAVRGDSRAASAVGQVAATVDRFPNPHRVLKEGGVIPSGWHSSENATPAPDECRRRLEAEGVAFEPTTGKARRESYVGWDTLVERLRRAEAAKAGGPGQAAQPEGTSGSGAVSPPEGKRSATSTSNETDRQALVDLEEGLARNPS